jgi:hypothetical protein
VFLQVNKQLVQGIIAPVRNVWLGFFGFGSSYVAAFDAWRTLKTEAAEGKDRIHTIVF